MGEFLLNGVKYKNIGHACIELKISRSLVNLRLERGWSLEDAFSIPTDLDSIVVKNPPIEYKGKQYLRYSLFAKEWGLATPNVLARVYMGESLDSIVKNKKASSILVFEGIEYVSVRDVLKTYGCNISTGYSGLIAGYTLDYIVYRELGYLGRDVGSHKKTNLVSVKSEVAKAGFTSLTSLCEEWGLNRSKLSRRLKNGFTLEEAILYQKKNISDEKMKMIEKILIRDVKNVSDENNIVDVKYISQQLGFKNLKSLCEYYGLNYSMTNRKLLAGDSLKVVVLHQYDNLSSAEKLKVDKLIDDLSIEKTEKETKEDKEKEETKKIDVERINSLNVIVYRGKEYNNIDTLIKELGINKVSLARLVRSGFDLEFSIDLEVEESKRVKK